MRREDGSKMLLIPWTGRRRGERSFKCNMTQNASRKNGVSNKWILSSCTMSESISRATIPVGYKRRMRERWYNDEARVTNAWTISIIRELEIDREPMGKGKKTSPSYRGGTDERKMTCGRGRKFRLIISFRSTINSSRISRQARPLAIVLPSRKRRNEFRNSVRHKLSAAAGVIIKRTSHNQPELTAEVRHN